MRPAWGVCSTKSSGRLRPVGKCCPWPAQEPRWCRLLPTAWLSGFPSGLASFTTPTSFCPLGVREATGNVVLQSLSPMGFPKSLPHTPRSQASPERTKRGTSSCPKHPCPWICPPSLPEPYTRLHSPAITGLWVWDVVFAAGPGRSSWEGVLGSGCLRKPRTHIPTRAGAAPFGLVSWVSWEDRIWAKRAKRRPSAEAQQSRGAERVRRAAGSEGKGLWSPSAVQPENQNGGIGFPFLPKTQRGGTVGL